MFILDNVLTTAECSTLAAAIAQHYQKHQDEFPEKHTGDTLVSQSFSAYALPETEELLLKLTPQVSKITRAELYPTYSYCRMYFPRASMKKHVDRAACEVSMSLFLGGDSWPLWFLLDQPTPVTLDVGSAVLYPGLDTVHWREEYTGTGCTQVFLHWVNANGPHSSWKYDKRPSIGAAEIDKNYWGKS